MRNGTGATNISKISRRATSDIGRDGSMDLAVIAGVSAIAGSRATLPPALLFPENKILRLMSAGEAYADKLPGIGDRIAPGGLIGRGISGALTGAIVSRRKGSNMWIGALVGAAAACASAYVTYYARKKVGKITGAPDAVVGFAEDVAMVCLGTILLENDRI